MSSAQLTDLLTLVVEEIHGDVPALVFNHLLKHSTVQLRDFLQTDIQPRLIRPALSVLIQYNLAFAYPLNKNGAAFFKPNVDAAYLLLRSGKYLELLQERLTPAAVGAFESLMVRGRAPKKALDTEEGAWNQLAPENADLASEPGRFGANDDIEMLDNDAEDTYIRRFRLHNALAPADFSAVVERRMADDSPEAFAQPIKGPKKKERAAVERYKRICKIRDHNIRLEEPPKTSKFETDDGRPTNCMPRPKKFGLSAYYQHPDMPRDALQELIHKLRAEDNKPAATSAVNGTKTPVNGVVGKRKHTPEPASTEASPAKRQKREQASSVSPRMSRSSARKSHVESDPVKTISPRKGRKGIADRGDDGDVANVIMNGEDHSSLPNGHAQSTPTRKNRRRRALSPDSDDQIPHVHSHPNGTLVQSEDFTQPDDDEKPPDKNEDDDDNDSSVSLSELLKRSEEQPYDDDDKREDKMIKWPTYWNPIQEQSDTFKFRPKDLEPQFFVDHEKMTVRMRTKALTEFCDARMGDIPAQVYQAALRYLETRTDRCFDPFEPPAQDGLKVKKKPNSKDIKSASTGDDQDDGEEDIESKDSEDEDSDSEVDKVTNARRIDSEAFCASDIEPYLPIDVDLRAFYPGKNSNRSREKHAQDGDQSESADEEDDNYKGNERDGAVNNVLQLLSIQSEQFLKRLPSRIKSDETNETLYKINFTTAINNLIDYELQQYIRERFEPEIGAVAARVVRALTRSGKLDDKQLGQACFVDAKTLREATSQLQAHSLLDVQEVPKDNVRAASRAIYLFTWQRDRARRNVLNAVYKMMARLLRHLRFLRVFYRNPLDKSLRSDVAGREADRMAPAELAQLADFRRAQEQIWTELHRLDDIVVRFRDFLPLKHPE